MKKRSEYYNNSIKRAFKVLSSFSVNEKELGITDLSKRLKIHKSTIHRILVTLEDENIIIKNKTTQKYTLGMKLFELGNIAKEQIEIRKYAFTIMEDLAKKTGESIDLNILIDDMRVSVEKIDSHHDLRRIIQLGKSLPLYCGGSGKVILAFLPDKEIDRIINNSKLSALGPNTITDPVILKKHLKEIRKKGYALSFEERVLGSSSIAAPVLDYQGYAIASISISAPITRLTKEKLSLYKCLIKESAEKISNTLGYNKQSGSQELIVI